MRYEFVDVIRKRPPIGDMREQITIETVNMMPTNDLSGTFDDSIVTIAANIWAAVYINRGIHRMLTINTERTEIATHEFYVRYWNEDFLEARYISWRNNRYRILSPNNLGEKVNHNFRICFPCILKGSTSKDASTWS
jgi:hypothetical protein